MSLLHVNSLCRFFTGAAGQKLIFMFLVTTKLILNFVKVSDFHGKIPKNPLSEL